MNRKRATIVLPFGLFTILVFVIFFPAFFPPPGQMLFGDDFFRSYGFFREYFAKWIVQGILPWWNPYLFSGVPFAANPSISLFYPPNILYVLLPVRIAYPVLMSLHVVIAMSAMYWFVRSVTGGSSRTGAFFAGIAYGLSGYLMARIYAGHSEILSSVPYIPLVFGLFYHAMDKRSLKMAVMAGAALAIQILAGYQTIAVLTVEATVMCFVVFCITKRSFRHIRELVVGGMTGFGLSLFQMIPYLEFFRHSVRTASFPYEWSSYGSTVGAAFIQLIAPFAWGDQRTFGGPPPNYWEQAAFTGRITVVMAGVALVAVIAGQFRKKYGKLFPLIIMLFCIAVYAVWMAIGTHAPFNLHQLMWTVIPFHRSIRFPVRFLVLLVFAVPVLGGIGVSLMKNSFLKLGITGILIIEMVPFARHFIDVALVPGSLHDTALISLLTKDTQPYRVLQNFGVWIPPRDSLDFDAVMPYGIYSATGYDPSMIRTYYDFIDAVNGSAESSLLKQDVQIPYLNVYSPYTDFLNIKYILVPRSHDSIGPTNDKYALVLEDANRNYRLYENKTVLPRFFLVPNVTATGGTPVDAVIRQGTADLSRTILHQSSGKLFPPDTCQSGDFKPVTVKSYTPNEIILSVTSGCDSYLSTSEVMYPGWTAAIDGKKTELLVSNRAFRAVKIPKGEHTVRFLYVPYSFIFGGFGSLCTIAFILYFVLRKTDSYPTLT